MIVINNIIQTLQRGKMKHFYSCLNKIDTHTHQPKHTHFKPRSPMYCRKLPHSPACRQINK